MSQRATIADVARLAGVHPGTVSRALNSRTEGQVNPETIRRVRAAARQLGYTPNSIARGLRTSSSMTIGVIVPDLTNPIFPPIVRGIESYLTPRGYSALVVNTDGSDATEHLVFQSLTQRQVDGLIFATGHQVHPTATEAFELGLKAVMVNRESDSVPYPAAVGDDAQGVRASLAHLAELGHHRVVHLAGPSAFSTSQVRREAFVAGCLALGLDGSVVETAAYSVDEGQRAVDQIIAAGELPTAIVAGNDLLALGVYHSLRRNALRCPDDVSVVGFNDMPFAGDFEPAMTTVRVPHFELGVEAARLLCEEIETSVVSAIKVVLPVALVVRASTARAR